MYTVLGGIRSRAFRVLWMLEELGQPYEHISTPPRSEDVRKYNTSGKIPVLLDNGAALTDSTAILHYLADKHGALTFPSGSIERARQDGITHFVLDEFDALLWTASRHSFILPEEQRVPAIKDSLKWEFETSLARLAERLGDSPFLTGDTMTVPDIIATHCCGWATVAKFPMRNDVVNAYVERMRARPAYQRTSALG